MDDSRRTNILVGDDILVKIDDTKNVTHHNGVMTVEFNTIPNPLTIGVDAFHSSPNVPNPYIVRNNVSRQLATINDLETKADVTHTHSYDSLTGTPPSSGGSTAFSVEFKQAGALTLDDIIDLEYMLTTNAELLGGEIQLGHAGGNGYSAVDIRTYNANAQLWETIKVNIDDDPGFFLPRQIPNDVPAYTLIDPATITRSPMFPVGTRVRCVMGNVATSYPEIGLPAASDLRVVLRFAKR